jgi:ATP-dependent protease HslVU (ClpYQ) peptidase subunit
MKKIVAGLAVAFGLSACGEITPEEQALIELQQGVQYARCATTVVTADTMGMKFDGVNLQDAFQGLYGLAQEKLSQADVDKAMSWMDQSYASRSEQGVVVKNVVETNARDCLDVLLAVQRKMSIH